MNQASDPVTRPTAAAPRPMAAAQDAAGSGLGRFLNRRGFLRNSVAAGAGLMLTSKSAIAQQAGRTLKVGMVGCGAQGRALQNACVGLDGMQFTAVCDIWPHNLRQVHQRIQRINRHDATPYEDYEEMLDKEDLDAVLLPTPDHLHAPYTRMALEKGLAVYCEKMMSNTIEGARDMVKAQRETGGILQIGHQRRSNPRYLHARDQVFYGNELLGRVTHVNAQWNRAVAGMIGYPQNAVLDAATLQKHGYESMEQFMNWRWFKKFGGGPISDLGAHQIDMFNWFFKTTPKSLIASGGVDYYDSYEHNDNVMAIYEYELADGNIARAYYQVLTTTSSQGFYEKFMGEDAALVISESPGYNQVWREARVQESWDHLTQGDSPTLLRPAGTIHHKFWQQPRPWTQPTPWLDTQGVIDVRESEPPGHFELPVSMNVPYHQPHLQNFFEAVRKNDPSSLNCTVQQAFECCVITLACNEAIETGRKIEFTKEDFTA